MSIQDEEKDMIDIKYVEKKEQNKKLSLLEVNRHDYNLISYSKDYSQKK
jgi:hypothetical protein